MTGAEEDVVAELSAPVQAALDAGVELVESVLRELTSAQQEVHPT
jgi:hypothetical protein